MKRYLVYIAIACVAITNFIDCADIASSRKSLWHHDHSLNKRTEEFFKKYAVTESDILDIKNTVDGDLLVLYKTNIGSAIAGENQILTLIKYNPQADTVNATFINNPPLANRSTFSLINDNHMLGLNSDGVSVLYVVENASVTSVDYYRDRKNLKRIKNLGRRVTLRGDYPSHYWICSEESPSKKCNLHEQDKKIILEESDNKDRINDYIPEIAETLKQQVEKKLMDWAIKGDVIATLEYNPDKIEPHIKNTMKGQLLGTTVQSLLPYSTQEGLALYKELEKTQILHIKLDNKKYSTLNLKLSLNPLQIALCRNKESKLIVYALVQNYTQKKIIVYAMLDALLKNAQVVLHGEPKHPLPKPEALLSPAQQIEIPNLPSIELQADIIRTKAHLKKSKAKPPLSTVKENSNLSALLDPDHDFQKITLQKIPNEQDQYKLEPLKKAESTDHVWKIERNGTILVTTHGTYVTNNELNQDIKKIITISNKEGFIQHNTGRVDHIQLVDLPNIPNMGIAYITELKYKKKPINAQNIIPIDATLGKIGIINQPYFSGRELYKMGIAYKSDEPNDLANASQEVFKISATDPDMILHPQFLIVDPKKQTQVLQKTPPEQLKSAFEQQKELYEKIFSKSIAAPTVPASASTARDTYANASNALKNKTRELKTDLKQKHSYKPTLSISTKNKVSPAVPVIKSLPLRILDTIKNTARGVWDSFKKFWEFT